MRNINVERIVREEIEKYIISENINTIAGYVQPLESMKTQLSSFQNPFGQDAENFLYSLLEYTTKIIDAINRCVKANSLDEGTINELFGDYGIEIPKELGGNLLNDFQRSYYNTRNNMNMFFNNRRIRNKGTSSGYDTGNSSHNKLSYLLGEYDSYKSTYDVLNAKYQMETKTKTPKAILTLIWNLKNDYEATVNAQGNNP